MSHAGVLLKEVVEILDPQRGQTILDGTIGNGGHARALLPLIGERGLYIGLDRDKDALDRSRNALSQFLLQVRLYKSDFRNLDSVLEKEGLTSVDRVLFDLGFNSDQLTLSGRGFSFLVSEPLLMTYEESPEVGVLTAWEILNRWNERDIADLIFSFGEERFSRKIARGIIEAREEKPIATTTELVRIIESSVPQTYRRGRIHPATRTFQALRIAVNDELKSLSEGLLKGFEALASPGRMAVISFQSLEDRIVKNFFRSREKEGRGEILTKKPITASREEEQENPRSRSAKLRGIKKI